MKRMKTFDSANVISSNDDNSKGIFQDIVLFFYHTELSSLSGSHVNVLFRGFSGCCSFVR